VKPRAFRYHRPSTLADALRLLAEHRDAAKPIAGGQSLVPMMNLRVAQPDELVDLNDLAELQSVREAGAVLEVGAMVRHQDLADSELVRRRCPLLAEAAGTIGHYAIRQRGTIGGSLAHADPAAQLPLVAAVLGAQFELASARGRRVVPAADFFVSIMTTALEPDEIIASVRFPCAADGEASAFRQFSLRHGDFAIVSVAATLNASAGRVGGLRLAVGGTGPVPEVFGALAAAQAGRRADAAWVAELAAAVRAAVDVPEGGRIPEIYRRELAETLVARALRAALERCGARP
jgi:aerobic carbon-monoxide dehydrogenase medium subunit